MNITFTLQAVCHISILGRMVQDNIFECLCSEDGYEHKKPMKNCFLTKSRDFSGGPVVKIPRFQCRGWEGSTPGPETETPHATQYGPKPKTKSTQFWFSRNIHLSEWKRNRQQTQLNKGTRKGQRMISTCLYLAKPEWDLSLSQHDTQEVTLNWSKLVCEM